MAGLAGYKMSDDCGIKPSSLASIHACINKEIVSMAFDEQTGRWTAIAMGSDGQGTDFVFKKYEFKVGEAELKSNATTENRVTKYVNTVTFKAEKMSEATVKMIAEFAENSYCGSTLICENFYGEQWVVGWDKLLKGQVGLELQGGELGSGRGLSGAQGGDITLGNETPYRLAILEGVNIPV